MYLKKKGPGRGLRDTEPGSARDGRHKPSGSNHQGHPLLSELAEHRDRLEVWICLHQLLDRLKARVGNALDSYEHDLEWNEDLVDELKAEVNRFTTLAAHLRRRRS